MLASLSLIFLVGLAMAAIVQRLQLPRIIGMLVTGILFFLSSFVSSFHQYTFLQTLLIIAVVFLPSSFHYCLTYSRHKQMISHRNTHMSVVE